MTRTTEELLDLPNIYEGGEPNRVIEEMSPMLQFLYPKGLYYDGPTDWRVQIVSVVTNSTTNSTALEYVDKVYQYIRNGTNHDPRINYQTICLTRRDGSVLIY